MDPKHIKWFPVNRADNIESFLVYQRPGMKERILLQFVTNPGGEMYMTSPGAMGFHRMGKARTVVKHEGGWVNIHLSMMIEAGFIALMAMRRANRVDDPEQALVDCVHDYTTNAMTIEERVRVGHQMVEREKQSIAAMRACVPNEAEMNAVIDWFFGLPNNEDPMVMWAELEERKYRFPFKEGDTYYTIENGEVIESVWDDISETELHRVGTEYFRTELEAKAALLQDITVEVSYTLGYDVESFESEVEAGAWEGPVSQEGFHEWAKQMAVQFIREGDALPSLEVRINKN